MHAYVVVDAFARKPLTGNPVAVFFDGDDLPAARMQRIAREMNLSETTFVLQPREGGDARVRIFTPVNELPFAGHPLLGTAIALGTRTEAERLRLETAMGVIPFELEREGPVVRAARMRQPVPTWEPFDRAPELLAALGLDGSTLPVEIYRNGPRHVFVGLDSVAALSALDPDHRALGAFPDMATNCFAGAGGRWRSRMFSPAYGVVEDAATGSAAGPLAIHLARHGLAPYGTRIEITQGVEIGRPSPMRALALGQGERVDTVEVAGDGVVVIEGTLTV
ncbi:MULTISPECIES: PhzF family phenazine biosynthesis protein [Streptomyces]|uniref:Putative trans-2,3-dihydro-3-hydroxyanthranilate isomerase n=1 Tax=Streptomyces albus (strain ATCC 21838 / DSM 41398 / FERM P-419 / JCM 4703 / NBRC 107858) TaxID=1081613 RepID=A0A0B5EP75_STRA4|nr:PhzF family phenazine biosynthesis isomerase [Streptomyces sp. SCSIO ZS0520]AJE80611.1 putative trans-2,3-dihydro-3-hydroxyanthranilate isomerase [Streptomyces albus]AOU74924.1 putative trans-2,3-dihydro-3-hydroxyanthranilate isomerase [Streptomyces albus]AYN30734.1 2,3-dihydro-3-hydroxyanthranilate isomerase [Streptomyces albus]